MNIVGIYHKSCIDGTMAAAILLKKFPEAKLFPLPHGFDQKDVDAIKAQLSSDTDLYYVDNSIAIDQLAPLAGKVTVIDHHESEKPKLDAMTTITYVFDNDKSGASLTWAYFFPEEPLPELIKYVEDGDLYRMVFGNDTIEATNYLSLYRNIPAKYLQALSEDVSDIQKKGKIVAEYVDMEVAEMIEAIHMIPMKIGPYIVPGYNMVVQKPVAAMKLVEATGKAVGLFTLQGEMVRISFRSKEGMTPTALDIATELKGGGHKHATGATVSLEGFLKLIS